MRTLDATAIAALASKRMGLAYLVELQLTEPLVLSTTLPDVVYDGDTYIGAGKLVGIEQVKDVPGNEALQFSLSGADSALVSIARGEPIKGRLILLREAVLDMDTHAVLDAPLVWSGTLDQMPIKFTGGENPSAVIAVTAQHRGITFARPKPLRYTDADQQRLYPGDTSQRFINSQAGVQIVWPSVAYFKQQL